MNKVQITGIILLLVGLCISIIYKNIDFGMIPAGLIGLGAGLTVYKKRGKNN
ncbi:MAG: hypothetical protein KJO83_05500 [Bacteroidia bacterium]|nr:hypothetical protein [Bacteroidia bacterium]